MWHMSIPCGTTLMLLPTSFTHYLDLDFDFDLRLQKNLTLTIILNQRRKDPYIIYVYSLRQDLSVSTKKLILRPIPSITFDLMLEKLNLTFTHYLLMWIDNSFILHMYTQRKKKRWVGIQLITHTIDSGLTWNSKHIMCPVHTLHHQNLTWYHVRLVRNLYLFMKTSFDSSAAEPKYATTWIAVRC